MLWGLFMIVPDVLRVVQPLSSFGFYANNDGLIYDVSGPFNDKIGIAGLERRHPGRRRLDLTRIRCSFKDRTCGDALAVLGGVEFVLPGRKATVIPLAAMHGQPARQVTLVAEQRPSNFVVRASSCSTRSRACWW